MPGEGHRLREARPNELRVAGPLPATLRDALRANKLAVLAELWRRREWGEDYAADWRSHCRREWEGWRQGQARDGSRLADQFDNAWTLTVL